jgi:hypothetical protein
MVAVSAAAAAALASINPAAAREPSSRLFVLGEGGRSNGFGTEPYGDVAGLPDGGLLVATHMPTPSVYRIAVDGARAQVRLPVPGADEFWRPRDLLPQADGAIIVADHSTIWSLSAAGDPRRLAGTGTCSFSGDGRSATSAEICLPAGLARTSDGAVLFADTGSHRIRRIESDGTIRTVAGSQFGFGGDGGPATLASLRFPADVLPLPAGGFLIADSFNGRVRRVTADGQIDTVAGNDGFPFDGDRDDGGPAIDATIEFPEALEFLADGTIAIGARCCVRRVGDDGTITTPIDLLHPVRRSRLGDFAGRYGFRIDALAVTREGGLAISAVSQSLHAPPGARSVSRFGARQVIYYLAPLGTERTLVAFRDARASESRLDVAVDATKAGRARLEVRRGGRLIASTTREIRPGRRELRVSGRFGAATNTVTLTLTAAGDATARDRVELYTGRTLQQKHLSAYLSFLGNVTSPVCRRMSSRRIDCEIWQEPDPDEESREPRCAGTRAFRLAPSGTVFARVYRHQCSNDPGRRFRVRPGWSGAWQIAPLGITEA